MVAALCALSAAVILSFASGTQLAQVESALVSVSVSARVSSEVDCETDPITHVYFDVVPKEGAEVTVIDHGQVRRFDYLGSYEEAGLDGYFANGSYEGVVTARLGYLLQTPAVLAFTVASVCGGVPVSPVTAVPTTTSQVLPPSVTLTPAPEPLPPPPTPAPLPPPTKALEKSAVSPAPTDSASPRAQGVVPVAACGSAEECRAVCSAKGGTASCEKFATQAIVPVPLATIPEAELNEDFRAKTMGTYLVERRGVRTYADQDRDGIADFDEVNIYGTDPNAGDTDKDGVTDGDELLAQTDPAGGNVGAVEKKILFEDVATRGVTASSTFAVLAIWTDPVPTHASSSEKTLSTIFTGLAPANSFITIFIYSEPIVVTVKTDEFGTWTYALDRELPDGSHEVFAAVADSKGRVWAKSSPLPFVKEAAAASLGSAELLPRESAPSFFAGSGILMALGVIIVVLVAGILVFGAMRQKSDAGVPS